MEDKQERNDNDATKKVPDDNALKSKEEEDREHVEQQVLAVMKKNRKEITPEYRKVLIERLEKARAIKNKGKKVGVKLKRTIMPDPDEKQNYCSICKRSYKTARTLKQHCQRIHGEKKMSVKIKDAEAQQQETESKSDETKKQTEDKTEDGKENKVIKPTNEVIAPHVEKITDKERLLIAQQKQAQQKQIEQQKQAQQKIIEQQKQAQQKIMQNTPPPSPKLTRQPPTEPRYTIKEFRMMEARQKEVMKIREKEMKAKAKQEHIQKSVALMIAGGIR